MTPKKVWGIILIILGLMAIFNGASSLNEVENIDAMIKFTGMSQFYSGKQFAWLNLEKIKHDANLGIYFGIVMAIIGTWMLKDTTTKKQKRFTTDNINLGAEPDVASDETFAYGDKEDTELSTTYCNNIKIKPFEKPRIIDLRTGKEESSDDERWMHPSMRGKKD